MAQADPYLIDKHKLHLHPERVADWLAGKTVVPIYMELSPSGACNQRCRFCGMDFMGYKKRFLPTAVLIERLVELGKIGLKSIMFGGEGEPLLHPDLPDIASRAKAAGIDLALTSNGVFLTPETAKELLPSLSWMKISFNAGRADTYAHIHGAAAEDFTLVMDNAREAVKLQKEMAVNCTIGFQMLLLPENAEEAPELARRVRDLGADYLVIKPYAVHRLSGKEAYADFSYTRYDELAGKLADLNRDGFHTVFRHQALNRGREKQPCVYGRCRALPFWAYVDSGGSVWGCLRHIGENEFLYGNLIESSASEIIHGAARGLKMAAAAKNMDIENCHLNCRMEPINYYLWELAAPPAHANFI